MRIRKLFEVACCAVLLAALAGAQEKPAVRGSQPALTIYNGGFGVIRERFSLELEPGVNHVRFTDATAFLEPDSVVLRDPSGQRALGVLEQNYRNDPINEQRLLSLYEGKTLDFLVNDKIVKGRVIRSGYVPRMYNPNSGYSQPGYEQPIIEVDGLLRFGLPGQPQFPALVGESILKPELNWLLQTDKPGKFDAEISYISSGMSWESDYNLVVSDRPGGAKAGSGQTDLLDMVGWVTLNNQSGRIFENARIKLMAGDVNKIQPNSANGMFAAKAAAMEMDRRAIAPQVTERTFDEYHLYTLERPTTLYDHETKQVEFVRATGISARKIYLYDGANIPWQQYQYYSAEQMRQERDLGTQSNNKIWVVEEFKNEEANHLGMPLPKGRLRFYRRDLDGHLEFIGESMIDHTPKDETIRVYTGNAFDLTGERKRTNFSVDYNAHWMDETFEIKLRNHKKEAVTFTAVEHLYRCNNWKIVQASHPSKKTESQRMEFRVDVPANGEQVVTYTVHYTW